MRKLILSLVVAVSMTFPVFAQQEMSASGQVVSVRLLTRTMTVRDDDANEVIRYDVPMSANVTLAGQPGRLGYLRSGDTVNVSYTNTDGGRRAVRVRVPQPTSAMDGRIAEGPMSTVTGRVERVDARNRTVTVLGDQSGERFTYAVPEGTRVSVGGEQARLNQIQRGDNVILRFKDDAGQRQAARIRVPQTTTPLAQRAAPPAGVAAQPARAQLPRTASSVPMLSLIGILALLGAVAVRALRLSHARVNNR